MKFETRLTDDLIARYQKSGHWGAETFYSILAARAAAHPDRIAIVDRGRRVTYRELRTRVDRVAAGFAALGIGPGDVVTIQMPNWAEFAYVFFALERLGAVANQIGSDFRSREVEYILRFSESRAFVCPASFKSFDYVKMSAELRPGLPDLKAVCVLGSPATGGAAPGLVSLDSMVENAGAAAPPGAGQRANDVMRMAFTSGTTGNPKGVIHSHNTTLSTCRTLNAARGRARGGDRHGRHRRLGPRAPAHRRIGARRDGGGGGRDRRARTVGASRLPQESGGERRALHRRRLVPHGRPRAVRPGREREDRRPAQGDDQPRRQEVLPAGDRGDSLHPPENPARRHRGRARPAAGRAKLSLRDPATRADRHPGRDGRLSKGRGGDLQATGDDRDLRRAAVHADGQDPAPRARPARARAPGTLVLPESNDRVAQGGDFALTDPPIEPAVLLGDGLLLFPAVAPAPIEHHLHPDDPGQLALQVLVEGGVPGADHEQETNPGERARRHPGEEVEGVAPADPMGLGRVIERRPLPQHRRPPLVLTPGAGDFHLRNV